MVNPGTPERITELVSRANKELEWAVTNEDHLPRLRINLDEVRLILTNLILPTFPGSINKEFAAQFVNGDLPTQAFRLSKNSYDMVSLEYADAIEPHGVVDIKQWAEIPTGGETYFGTFQLVGIRAMALAVPKGGKLRVNPDGVDEWLESYKRIHP